MRLLCLLWSAIFTVSTVVISRDFADAVFKIVMLASGFMWGVLYTIWLKARADCMGGR
ncbi:MAG: hypothetical protein ACTHNM_17115 [Dyella sp.]|uniref:hypothetical protein n=1 Tax=Dyella sp. TaxID=1869338 RepID=UPI003F81F4AD